ncbi:MAG: hypothetical protein ACE5EV_08470, partial [Gaiellales bacterium]
TVSAGSISAGESGQEFPDIVDATVAAEGEAFDFRVTVSSPYDTPTRYADGWRVRDEEGTVFGEHTLAHSHENEQPFTRSQAGVAIPEGVTSVVVEGRDIESGYGGSTVSVALPGRGR